MTIWPQILIIVWYGVLLGACLMKDGEPKKGKVSFIGQLIGTIITVFVLYAGGFFDVLFK